VLFLTLQNYAEKHAKQVFLLAVCANSIVF